MARTRSQSKANADAAKKSGGISAWVTFFNERVPLVVYLLLSIGPSLSAMLEFGGQPFPMTKFYLGSLACFLFMVAIRFMDDVKDYDKDVIAHPERPLPRGLLTCTDVKRGIFTLVAAMFGLAGLFYTWYGPVPGYVYGFQVFYLCLMYIEFGCGEWLEARPLLYAATHQIVIFPCCISVATLADPTRWNDPSISFLGALGLSGFFTFEVARKLDPKANPILGTYLVTYGRLVTFLLVAGAVSLGVFSAKNLGLLWVTAPMQGTMVVSLALLFLIPQKKSKHKIVEGFSILYLLTSIWSIPIAHYFG